MQLSDYIGRAIVLVIPLFPASEAAKPTSVKLLGVETGGIWVENEAFANQLFEVIEEKPSATPPAFFVPYHALQFGVVFSRIPVQDNPSPHELHADSGTTNA
jgi:hypothetical protein